MERNVQIVQTKRKSDYEKENNMHNQYFCVSSSVVQWMQWESF